MVRRWLCPEPRLLMLALLLELGSFEDVFVQEGYGVRSANSAEEEVAACSAPEGGIQQTDFGFCIRSTHDAVLPRRSAVLLSPRAKPIKARSRSVPARADKQGRQRRFFIQRAEMNVSQVQ